MKSLLQAADLAYRKGRLSDAERMYKAVLKVNPLHAAANHNLGVIAIELNQASKAVLYFKTALDSAPQNSKHWLNYIDTLVQLNQLVAAKRVLKEGKKRGLSEENLKVLESKIVARTGGESLERSLEENLQRLSKVYQNGEYESAEALANLVVSKYPDNQLGWKVLGAVLRRFHRNSEAEEAYRKAIEISPQDAEAHYNLGNTLKELERLEEAALSLKKAIILNEEFSDAHNNLGNTLKELGKLEDSELCYLRAVKLAPERAECHYNLGLVRQKLNKLELAEASYRKAVSIKPNFAEAFNNLGSVYKELGKLDDAEASYSRAIVLQPNFQRALMNRWRLYFDKGEYVAALNDADACINEGPRERDLRTLYALGRKEEIEKRIDVLAKKGTDKISVAAFATFYSHAENKGNVYNFCPNPFDFLEFSNLNAHIKKTANFVNGLMNELGGLKTSWEPSGKSTVNGFQSLEGTNIFEKPSGKIARLKSIIIKELTTYYTKHSRGACSFIQNWPADYNLFGWQVILKKQGYQKAHIHPGGWLSGVIYLKVVPALGKNEGAIEFSLNSPDYSSSNSPSLTHIPEVGEMIFFPSSLHHRTIPFVADENRVIISFDLIPRAVSV